MEKYQIERREKIVGGILVALGAGALYAKKGDRLFHARAYPGGGVIIDVIDRLKDTKNKSIRIGVALKGLTPLKFEVDEAEHTEAELTEVEELSRAAIEEHENTLQTG